MSAARGVAACLSTRDKLIGDFEWSLLFSNFSIGERVRFSAEPLPPPLPLPAAPGELSGDKDPFGDFNGASGDLPLVGE